MRSWTLQCEEQGTWKVVGRIPPRESRFEKLEVVPRADFDRAQARVEALETNIKLEMEGVEELRRQLTLANLRAARHGFVALTSTDDGRLTAGKVYHGNLILKAHTPTGLRVVVYDNRGEWMTFDPKVFQPGSEER